MIEFFLIPGQWPLLALALPSPTIPSPIVFKKLLCHRVCAIISSFLTVLPRSNFRDSSINKFKNQGFIFYESPTPQPTTVGSSLVT